MVVLPAPFSPTKAIFSPLAIVRVKFFKMYLSVVGYLNEMFLNSIVGGFGVFGIF